MNQWWEFVIAVECSDDMASELGDKITDFSESWATERGLDLHVDAERKNPQWLEHARDCQVPDCIFPAEWVVEVAANGSIIEFAGCGAHRLEIEAAANSSAEIAWGDTDVVVKEI